MKVEKLIIKGPHSILSWQCTDVLPEEDNGFLRLLKRVCRKARQAGGAYAAGMAASQIGMTKRAFFTHVNDNDTGPIRGRFYLNAELIPDVTKGRSVDIEGCFSYPSVFIPVARFNAITLRFQETPGGPTREEWFCGWHARVIQHEYDHTLGVCLVGQPVTEEAARLHQIKESRSKLGMAVVSAMVTGLASKI